MSNRVVTFETAVPEDVYTMLRAHGLERKMLAERSKRLLAMEFYRQRLLSLGRAARLANMNRWDFIEFLSRNDVPVIDFNEEELGEEFEAMRKLREQLRSKG